MNERLQGWRLALALLIPMAIVGAAAWFAYGALSDSDQDVATGTDEVVATATALPATEPIDAAPTAAPTQPPVPTALTLPTAIPAPTAETVSETDPADEDGAPAPTTAPTTAPTAAPAAAPTAAAAPAETAVPSGPPPTATPDPSGATLTCVGTVPSSAATSEVIGPLSVETNPPELADSYDFRWTIDDSRFVSNPSSGIITYDTVGTYTITVAGTSSTSDEALTATCGTVTIGQPVAAFRVSCSVSVTLGRVELAEAQAPESMTVTTVWTPNDKPLSLTYEFDVEDQIVIVDAATSGNQQINSFNSDSSTFSILWRDLETGANGLLSCPAYPGQVSAEPTPTAVGATDSDEDGIEDLLDNCPSVKNADQLNTDGDSQGNECDDDDDNDSRPDVFDNCPLVVNFPQSDSNGNGVGNACEGAPTPTPTSTDDT